MKLNKCPVCENDKLETYYNRLICLGECKINLPTDIWVNVYGSREDVLDYYAALIKPSWEE